MYTCIYTNNNACWRVYITVVLF